MSFLNKVFGKKTEKPPTLPEALQKLRHTEELLMKKQNYLELKIKKETAIAKQNASKNKKAAIKAIQRKKCYERQLQKLDGMFTTIESQRDILEDANTNALAVSSMQKASDALKAAHKFMSVDQVEEMLGNLADQKEIGDEISDAICNPTGFEDYDMDEDELEKELRELELEDSALSEPQKNSTGDKLPAASKEHNEKEKIKTPKKKKEAAVSLTAI